MGSAEEPLLSSASGADDVVSRLEAGLGSQVCTPARQGTLRSVWLTCETSRRSSAFMHVGDIKYIAAFGADNVPHAAQKMGL